MKYQITRIHGKVGTCTIDRIQECSLGRPAWCTRSPAVAVFFYSNRPEKERVHVVVLKHSLEFVVASDVLRYHEKHYFTRHNRKIKLRA